MTLNPELKTLQWENGKVSFEKTNEKFLSLQPTANGWIAKYQRGLYELLCTVAQEKTLSPGAKNNSILFAVLSGVTACGTMALFTSISIKHIAIYSSITGLACGISSYKYQNYLVNNSNEKNPFRQYWQNSTNSEATEPNSFDL